MPRFFSSPSRKKRGTKRSTKRSNKRSNKRHTRKQRGGRGSVGGLSGSRIDGSFTSGATQSANYAGTSGAPLDDD